MNDENENKNEIKQAPQGSWLVILTFSLTWMLSVLGIGFCLGFFPAFLSKEGTLALGMDRGWKIALVMLVALLAVAATYWVLKKWKLHPLFISVMMGMAGMAIMYTLGRAVTGEGDVWWRNLLSGLGNGAWIGGMVHVASRWKAKRVARAR